MRSLSSAYAATGEVDRLLVRSSVEGDENESSVTELSAGGLHGGSATGACAATA